MENPSITPNMITALILIFTGLNSVRDGNGVPAWLFNANCQLETLGLIVNDQAQDGWVLTACGQAYLKMLMEVPLPVLIQTWADPRTLTQEQQ